MLRLTSTNSVFLMLLGAILSALTGCSHPTVIVKQAVNGSAPALLPGIPFYLKHGVCTRETVWLEPQYTLSLTVSADDEEPIRKTMVLNRQGYQSGPTQGLISALSGLSGTYKLDAGHADKCPSVIGHQWDETETANAGNHPGINIDLVAGGLTAAEGTGNFIRVTNAASVTTEVDYTQLYYINATTPWIGSGSLDAKLAPDGTLSEGNAQVQDQTWSTIFGTITGLVGDVFGVGSASATPTVQPAGPVQPESIQQSQPAAAFACHAGPGWPAAHTSVKYQYSLTTAMYKHDHVDKSGDVSACTPTGGGVTGGSFTITEVKKDDGKPDKNAITVSGTVTLPDKPKDKGKDDKPNP
jgi:hypothetical protein